MSRRGDDLSDEVGARLRRWREDVGETQDALATAARSWGWGWTRSTVAALENGTRRLSAQEFIALPALVHQAFGREITFAELVADQPVGPRKPDHQLHQAVPLGGRMCVRPEDLWDALDGARYGSDMSRGDWTVETLLPPEEVANLEETTPLHRAIIRDISRRDRDRNLGMLGDYTDDTRHAMWQVRGADATDRVAKQLGTVSGIIDLACYYLYSLSLEDERDRRAGSNRAARGHATRAIIEELGAYLDRKRQEIS